MSLWHKRVGLRRRRRRRRRRTRRLGTAALRRFWRRMRPKEVRIGDVSLVKMEKVTSASVGMPPYHFDLPLLSGSAADTWALCL